MTSCHHSQIYLLPDAEFLWQVIGAKRESSEVAEGPQTKLSFGSLSTASGPSV
jgi:hypothetical protein